MKNFLIILLFFLLNSCGPLPPITSDDFWKLETFENDDYWKEETFEQEQKRQRIIHTCLSKNPWVTGEMSNEERHNAIEQRWRCYSKR